MDVDNNAPRNPHGLKCCGQAICAIYTVAVAKSSELRKRAIGIEEVKLNLLRLAPGSLFRNKGHMRIIFKLMNPSGHGANSPRFQNAALSWFRKNFPEDAHLSDGLALLICACTWWTEETGRRSVHARLPPLTTSDFDSKLKSFGFLQGERDALCKALRFKPRSNSRTE